MEFKCRHCGRAIQAHNLGEHNLKLHEDACIGQQQKKKSQEYRRQLKRAAKAARMSGVGSTVVPGRGQLGFPFDGVQEEVA